MWRRFCGSCPQSASDGLVSSRCRLAMSSSPSPISRIELSSCAKRPPTILVHEKLRCSDRLLIRIAEALAEGLGSRRLLTNTLVAFVAQLDGNPLASTHTDFARVLQISEQQVKGALGVTRAAIGS